MIGELLDWRRPRTSRYPQSDLESLIRLAFVTRYFALHYCTGWSVILQKVAYLAFSHDPDLRLAREPLEIWECPFWGSLAARSTNF